jgi:CTP synthase (UTP-ammonia lyase)
LLIRQLSCSLVGESERIDIEPGTLVHRVYGQEQVVEKYGCSYGLNPEYQEQIGRGTLKVVGRNAEGAVRVVELEGHRFFIASLFLPQMSSTLEKPHPMIKAYLKEAATERKVGFYA